MSEHQRLTQNILAVVAAYRAVARQAESTISRKFLGSGKTLDKIASQAGYSFPADSYDAWVAKFSAEWPDGAVWPPNVPRPAQKPPGG